MTKSVLAILLGQMIKINFEHYAFSISLPCISGCFSYGEVGNRKLGDISKRPGNSIEWALSIKIK